MSAFSNMYSPGGGGMAEPSTGSGGFFSNIYQNVADTFAVAEVDNKPGWWQQTLTQVGDIAATMAATRLQQARNAGITPVNVPQTFPPPTTQHEFPAETTRGPYQMAAAPTNGAKANGNQTMLLVAAGVAALVFLR